MKLFVTSPLSEALPKRYRVAPDQLCAIHQGKTILHFRERQAIFTQGDAAQSVFYVREGSVKLTVLSSSGKEATIGILGEGDFFGEESLAEAPAASRTSSAIALRDCTIARVEKKGMLDALHRDHELFRVFFAYLLARSIRYEEDLAHLIVNTSEKRLVRILVLLTHLDDENLLDDRIILNMSQTALAEMVGTTRSRINFLMGKLRERGFIDYEGGLRIHRSLLRLFLDE